MKLFGSRVGSWRNSQGGEEIDIEDVFSNSTVVNVGVVEDKQKMIERKPSSSTWCFPEATMCVVMILCLIVVAGGGAIVASSSGLVHIQGLPGKSSSKGGHHNSNDDTNDDSSVVTCSCKDESGNSVEWWFAYKFPTTANSEYSGQRYALMTSEDTTFKNSNTSITSNASVVGVTMAEVYANRSDLGYVLYNDQWPDGSTSSSYGHMKGVLAFDSTGGFFIQHSVPDFADYAKEGYEYGESQEIYGQQLSCFSLTLEDLNSLGLAMQYAGPWIYDHKQLDDMSQLQNLTDLVQGKDHYDEQKNVTVKLSSVSSLGTVRVFAKTGNFGADMIDAVVAPALKVPLVSQSWLNSGGKLGTYCPSNDSYVVDSEYLLYGQHTTFWKTSSDHSKWAVSLDDDSPFVCIADNNRVYSQYSRGGLATCFEHTAWHDSLLTGVLTMDVCTNYTTDDDVDCCHYSDTDCSSGDICCYSSCEVPSSCSYTESGCTGTYGQLHNCQWTNSTCVVP